ncbi:MAG: zinc ABC transporter substrate-binding protein [Dissulfuribacterales bacterium]
MHLFIFMVVLVLGWLPHICWASPLKIAVSILPEKYFVDRIGGDKVTVEVMIPPGANPAVYDPKPDQLRKLSACQLYFAIRVPFERVWVQKFRSMYSNLEVVDVTEGMELMDMAAHTHEDAGESGDHEHCHHEVGLKDPHVWLSPPYAILMAKNMLNAMMRQDPENASYYQANYDRLSCEINGLDAELHRIFSTHSVHGPRKFMVFHPAWGYFAKTYGLIQLPVELEGKEPKPAQLKEFIRMAQQEGLKVIFVQPQFAKRSAEVIARAIGARLITLDPLAYDWFKTLREAGQALNENAN